MVRIKLQIDWEDVPYLWRPVPKVDAVAWATKEVVHSLVGDFNDARQAEHLKRAYFIRKHLAELGVAIKIVNQHQVNARWWEYQDGHYIPYEVAVVAS